MKRLWAWLAPTPILEPDSLSGLAQETSYHIETSSHQAFSTFGVGQAPNQKSDIARRRAAGQEFSSEFLYGPVISVDLVREARYPSFSQIGSEDVAHPGEPG